MLDMEVIVRRQDQEALRLDHLHDQALCGPKGDFSGTGHFDLPALPCLAMRGLPCRTGALDRLALFTQVPRSLQHRRAGSAFSRPAG